MSPTTQQMKKWMGEFGEGYIQRNTMEVSKFDQVYKDKHGFTRSEIYEEFMRDIDRGIRILEVGCNVGIQLKILQNLGFKNLYGIEINKKAVEIAQKNTSGLNIIEGSAFDMPFKDGYFDLVFTSGVLIHIAGEDQPKAIREIHRCSNKYIMGYEYFGEKLTEIKYRGNEGMMWRNNYAKFYMDNFSDLELVKEKKYKYLTEESVDTMFLLKRK